jgi:hypothetical protein
LCGEDCSKRKRARDAQGRYFCLDCFEQRLEAVKRRRQREIDAVRENVLSDSMSSTFGADPELVASEAVAVKQEQAARPVPCPGCGGLVEPGAVLCVHCGHDFHAGTKLKVRKRVLSRERPALWPTAVGMLCVAFGAAGLFVYGRKLFEAVMLGVAEASASLGFAIMAIGGASTLLLLSALLILGGTLVWMRFASGIALLRFWLWVKLIMFTVLLLGGATVAFVFPAFVAELELLSELGLTPEQREPMALAILLGAIWLWQCAWPLALLFLFEGEQVQIDIRKWDEPAVPTTALYD